MENKPISPTIFDRDRCRHLAYGQTLVLHCHHFASLTTRLANDCSMLDAKRLLAECAEDTFYPVLINYYSHNNIHNLKDRIEAAERYFSEAGLGKLSVKYAGTCSGEVELKHSHVDEGWVNKWGTTDKHVNHIGCGYVEALFAAIYDKPVRTYIAKERQSIASGAEVSIITVTDVINPGNGGN